MYSLQNIHILNICIIDNDNYINDNSNALS